MFRTSTHLSRWQLCGLMVAATLQLGMSAQAQSVEGQAAQTSADEAPLFVCRFIEVAPENVAEWRERVAEKNAKFGMSDDPARYGTWLIMSGKRTNQYARGFVTTAELYSNPKHAVQGMAVTADLPQAAYWQENITPLQKSSGNRVIRQMITDLQVTHMDASQTPKFFKHFSWRLKPGMFERYLANESKMIEVYKQMDLSVNFFVSRIIDGGDIMTMTHTYAFDKMSDLPSPELRKQEFNKVHGEGAWDKFREERIQLMQENAGIEAETWRYEEKLSNLQP
ncbi:MAG: hypothetical protein MK106_01670 [Mariniblastus sp.]|nr:hypothetical protein [Mariniblastus sp.]